ncbi:MAG: nucleotidyltransferase domain-containing protein [Oscillospiraceae bacterium]|nr:nucleotidyltransferase domain-containing protein [Oscillospiraceae bacterium]
MVYTLEELRERIAPIARKYDIPAVYVFGSYARNQATDDSDIDVLINRSGSKIASMFDLGALYTDLNETLGKTLDLITEDALTEDEVKRRTPRFLENLQRERVMIYDCR